LGAIRESLRLMPGSALPKYELCFGLVATGQRDEAESVLREIQGQAAERYVKPYFIAMSCVSLGRDDEAFEILKSCWTERDPWMVWFGTEPKLNHLHGDPRFHEIFRATGNPLALR